MKPLLYCYSSPQYMPMALGMEKSAFAEFDPVILTEHEIPRIDGRGDLILQGYLNNMQGILAAMENQRKLGGEFLIWCQADALFLRPCLEDLMIRMEGRDALFLNDGRGQINTGFFVCRTTDKLRRWWLAIANDPQWWRPGVWTDYEEGAAWATRREIVFSLLPEDEYWQPCIPLRHQAVHGWNLSGLPATARMIHLGCVYPGDKTRVMNQILEATR